MYSAATSRFGKPLVDRMRLRCTNETCGNKAEVLFYLPEDYDPAKEVRRIKRFFEEESER